MTSRRCPPNWWCADGTAYASTDEATVVGIYARWLGADPMLLSTIYDSKSIDSRLVPLLSAAQAFWAVNQAALLQQKSITSKACSTTRSATERRASEGRLT